MPFKMRALVLVPLGHERKFFMSIVLLLCLDNQTKSIFEFHLRTMNYLDSSKMKKLIIG